MIRCAIGNNATLWIVSQPLLYALPQLLRSLPIKRRGLCCFCFCSLSKRPGESHKGSNWHLMEIRTEISQASGRGALHNKTLRSFSSLQPQLLLPHRSRSAVKMQCEIRHRRNNMQMPWILYTGMV